MFKDLSNILYLYLYYSFKYKFNTFKVQYDMQE